MIYGYARVSSKSQKLNVQEQALLNFGCDRIFKEKISACSGKREEFEKLISLLKSGDVLVVWKLDRLGRSMFDLVDIISTLKNKDVQFISLTENINTDTPTGKIMFMFFSMMAEYEMNVKKERIEAGKALAKKNGRLGGRPKGLSAKLKEKSLTIKKLYMAKEGDNYIYSLREIESLTGVSRPSIYKCLSFLNVSRSREHLFNTTKK